MADDEYLALEAKIDQLIAVCENLQAENEQLKQYQAQWHKERALLKEKNEHIRQLIERQKECRNKQPHRRKLRQTPQRSKQSKSPQ